MRIEIEADDDATVIIVTGGKARVVDDPQALTTRPAVSDGKWFQRQERNPRAAEPSTAPNPPEQAQCE